MNFLPRNDLMAVGPISHPWIAPLTPPEKPWLPCKPPDCPYPTPHTTAVFRFLLNSQLEDGSWYVQTRAAGFQPYFDNGFPHGVDQWISAAGTSWATMALTLASATHGATSTP